VDEENKMTLTIKSLSSNEAFARVAVSSFVSQLNLTVSDIIDIKTAVSEAVTNAIIHGYENTVGDIKISCTIKSSKIYIEISDQGSGIDDISKALTPLYTSKPDMDRSGLGFTVMETFMDDMSVASEKGAGTKICLTKNIKSS
jgi:stage II sporulation protein AB (anti-sigma F factor)